MKRTTFDAYITLHRRMWLDMCKEITRKKHPIDVYQFKYNWIYKNKTHAMNSCFLCECANILRDEADNETSDSMIQHTSKGLSCRYCPCIWPSNGDNNHEYMCEYNHDYNNKHFGHGLWMIANNIYGVYSDLLEMTEILNCELPQESKRKVDKLWRKQCKICFKIAMLPVRDDLDYMITESL